MNKHKAPPTPTIEEQLEEILVSKLILVTHDGEPKFLGESIREAVTEATLLITKARIRGYKLGVIDAANDEVKTSAQLEATTHPSYSPAPGTDGEA